MLPFALTAAAAMAAGWAASWPLNGHVALSLLVKVVVAAAAYVALLWLFGAAILKECIEFVKSRKNR